MSDGRTAGAAPMRGTILLLLLLGAASRLAAQEPLGEELGRLQRWLTDTISEDENFAAVKPSVERELGQADAALRRGRRLAALYRLTRVRGTARGVAFQLDAIARGRGDEPGLERTWTEVGAGLQAPDARDFAAIGNAAVRALAEAQAPQIRGLFVASLDYGRATTPATGLFYVGAAVAERELVDLLRSLPDAAAGRPLQLRPLAAPIAAQNRALLRAYRPPLAFEHHQEFVAAHSALAEARDLDSIGCRHGALLRSVQAAFRAALLQPTSTAVPRARIDERLADARKRIAADDRDHSIAMMLVELAEAELEDAGPDAAPPVAAAIATAGLPHYFAALEPDDAPQVPTATPTVTVTLVRWPFT